MVDHFGKPYSPDWWWDGSGDVLSIGGAEGGRIPRLGDSPNLGSRVG